MNDRTLHMLEARIRDAVSDCIKQDLSDPRLEMGWPSVTGVRLSPDISVAHVKISVMGPESGQRACWRGLLSARPRLQAYVARRLKTRTAPELILHLDESLKKAADVLGAINEAIADQAESPDSPDGPPGRDLPGSEGMR